MQPVKEADLQAAISIAMGRFEQLQLLKKEADDVRQTLQNRKIIERAKGILMMRGKLSEPEAFHRLQKLSWDKNKKLVDIAQIVITAEGGSIRSRFDDHGRHQSSQRSRHRALERQFLITTRQL